MKNVPFDFQCSRGGCQLSLRSPPLSHLSRPPILISRISRSLEADLRLSFLFFFFCSSATNGFSSLLCFSIQVCYARCCCSGIGLWNWRLPCRKTPAAGFPGIAFLSLQFFDIQDVRCVFTCQPAVSAVWSAVVLNFNQLTTCFSSCGSIARISGLGLIFSFSLFSTSLTKSWCSFTFVFVL